MTATSNALAFLGFGTAVPDHEMTQAEAVSLAAELYGSELEKPQLLRALYRRCGVERRHTVVPHREALAWSPALDREASAVASATSLGPSTRERMQLYAEHAPPLAIDAVSKALERASLDPREITHLVTVSCTGFDAPGVDVRLLREFALSPRVERVNVGFMGCHGAINGLRVARGLAATSPDAVVLLCAVELCSLHYHFRWDVERAVGNAIFADGAAAIVARATPQELPWRVVASGSCLIPDSSDLMSWQIGDHGFDMYLSPQVPDAIGQHLRPWMEAWLAEHKLSVADIGSWAVHPGGPRILTAVEEALTLDRRHTDTSREVLRSFGNLSSATVLFILQQLHERQAALPCVALAFGPGLVAEAVLIA